MREPTAPPPHFDESFIAWFRESTERAWSTRDAPTFDELEARGMSGLWWARGTQWTGGLSDPEIDEAERRWSLRFPPDYRLFLRMLHVPDRPMIGRGFRGNSSVPITGSRFYDWRADFDAIRDALDAPAEGIAYDVEANALWLREWGERPSSQAERSARVREAIARAPRLIPVFGHRYLIAEPCRAGNPVLSVHQSDIIVYGRDLRDYLLHEFIDEIGESGPRDDACFVGDLPFWGAFCSGEVFR